MGDTGIRLTLVTKLIAKVARSHPNNSICSFTQIVVQIFYKGKAMYEDAADVRGTGFKPYWKLRMSLPI